MSATRKILRNIARNNMIEEGFEQLNKKRDTANQKGKRTSKFADNWKHYVDPVK